MPEAIDAAAVAALADEPLDWRFKGLPSSWWGHTPAQVCASAPNLLDAGAARAGVRAARRGTFAQRRDDGQLVPRPRRRARTPRQDPHGPAAARPPVRVGRLCGHRRHHQPGPRLPRVRCARFHTRQRGGRRLGPALDRTRSRLPIPTSRWSAGWTRSRRRADGVSPGWRRVGPSTCASRSALPAVARDAAARLPSTRSRGPSSAARRCGWSVWPVTRRPSTTTSPPTRSPVSPLIWRSCGRPPSDWPTCSRRTTVVVTAGGSTYFDAVADELAIGSVAGRTVRTIVRSGCYLTHDDGLYARTSPLRDGLRPAMEVWAQVMSRPEPDLALLTMGRRDVSFDQGMPVPLGCRRNGHEAQRSARLPEAGARRTAAPSGWAAGCGSASRIRAPSSTNGR